LGNLWSGLLLVGVVFWAVVAVVTGTRHSSLRARGLNDSANERRPTAGEYVARVVPRSDDRNGCCHPTPTDALPTPLMRRRRRIVVRRARRKRRKNVEGIEGLSRRGCYLLAVN
jgi:hypothetical protein